MVLHRPVELARLHGMWQWHSSTLPHYPGPGCAPRVQAVALEDLLRQSIYNATCFESQNGNPSQKEILGKRSPAMKRCAILIFASVLSLSVRAGAQSAGEIHELKSSPSTVHRV